MSASSHRWGVLLLADTGKYEVVDMEDCENHVFFGLPYILASVLQWEHNKKTRFAQPSIWGLLKIGVPLARDRGICRGYKGDCGGPYYKLHKFRVEIVLVGV